MKAIPKVGCRGAQWLIVNELGGLVKEFSGTRRQAERKAETEARNRLELSRVQALDPGDLTGAFRND